MNRKITFVPSSQAEISATKIQPFNSNYPRVCVLHATNSSTLKTSSSLTLCLTPLLSSPCCGGFVCKELHLVRLSCNINGLLMDYGMVSAGLRERGGPPDAPPLLTAWPTQLNYSSHPTSRMLPVLSVSTTRGPRGVRAPHD